MNTRRKLVIALGAGALVAPFASFAQQQGKVWRVGFLAMSGRPASLESHFLGAFPQGMRELGYIEGKNLAIEWRFAEDKLDRVQELAAELVQLKMDVIVTSGSPATSAARKATTTIPIVMGITNDPVGVGFVKSLARPGGNITGLSSLNADIAPKLLEMLLSIVPKLSRAGVLVNPANPSHAIYLKNVQAAGQKARVRILPVEARTLQEIEKAFSILAKENVEGVILASDLYFRDQRRRIAELSAKYRLPVAAGVDEYAEVGGLMSYAQNLPARFRRAAAFVDKIFKGANPGELPVEQPTTFELVINRKTAKALGITIPQSLLISADKVIE
jgi:putative ABC transport system substrate-binding protein